MSLLTEASLVILPNAVEEGELFSIIHTDGSGDMTAVRATTATLVNSEGVIEDCPYNLIKYSEQFDNAIWIKTNTTITANATISPDGNNTAEQLFFTASGGFHLLEQSLSLTSGTSYTQTYFVKNNGQNFVQIYTSGVLGTTNFVNFNLTNGSISDSLGITGSIINYGNSWYRISVTATATSTGSGGFAISGIPTTTSTRRPSYTGSGQSIFLWGAQLVTGTEPKEYFPTTDRLNVPRLDYTNGSCPSILVEPQRTNLLLRSEEFDNISWGKLNATVIANSTISPNGGLNAYKIIATATNSNHIIFNVPSSFVSSQSYNFSYYAKSAEYTKTAIRIGGAGYSIVNRAEINLSNGTIIYQQGFTSLQVQSVGNGWYRIQGTFVSAMAVAPNIQPLSDSYSVVSNNYEFLGDGTSGIYIWGAQLEAGANATSYIPTVASSVTRNADVISKSGISDLIGQSEGTIFVDFNKAEIANSSGILELGEINNEIVIWQNAATQLRFFVRVSGSVFGSRTYNISDERLKIALTYQSNSYSVFLNGIKILDNIPITSLSTSYSGIILGNRFTNPSLSALNSSINSVVLWKTKLTDQQCINLTSI